MNDPYRILEEFKAMPEKKATFSERWHNHYPDGFLTINQKGVLAIAVLAGFFLSVIYCGNLYDKNKKQIYIETVRNTCSVVANTQTAKFQVHSFDNEANVTIEGFFANRKDATEFMNSFPNCQ